MKKFLEICDYIDALPESVVILFIIYAFILFALLRLCFSEFKSWQEVKRFFKPNKFK